MANTDIRQFGSAVSRGDDRGEEDEPLAVGIAGREVILHSPGSGQLAYLAASLAGFRGTLAQVGSLINFLANLMSEEDANWLEEALLKNDIKFEGEDALEMCQYLLEEWSEDRPTQPSSGSASRRQQAGPRSTPDSSGPPPARRRSTSSSRAS